ncbi:MAG: alkane 1-monooxygenase [Candidatus Kariarchaeaceae archaeon]|jgi:alkane 1-monooxygenase
MVSKNVNQLFYLVSFIPTALVVTGNLKGGWYAGMNAFFALVILVILDWLMPEDTDHPEDVSDLYADAILFVHVVMQITAISTLMLGIQNGVLAGVYIWLAVFSTGINSGQSGIIVAHELIHRKSRILRLLGHINLVQVLYLHWSIEHRYGHHRWVATMKDPATARYNETVYHFIARTIPQQFVSALRIETERRATRDETTLMQVLNNFVLRAYVVQIAVLVSIYMLLGPLFLAAFVGQALIAIILLELVNYIEHYGLLREEDQPFVIELAWNSDVVSSRYMLIDLVRHSDHHLKSYKPFNSLISYNDGSKCTVPTLPSGYWGVFYLTFFPRYWRKIMHPRIPKPMVDLYHRLNNLPIPDAAPG